MSFFDGGFDIYGRFYFATYFGLDDGLLDDNAFICLDDSTG
jgi:hypothetical protein